MAENSVKWTLAPTERVFRQSKGRITNRVVSEPGRKKKEKDDEKQEVTAGLADALKVSVDAAVEAVLCKAWWRFDIKEEQKMEPRAFVFMLSPTLEQEFHSAEWHSVASGAKRRELWLVLLNVMESGFVQSSSNFAICCPWFVPDLNEPAF